MRPGEAKSFSWIPTKSLGHPNTSSDFFFFPFSFRVFLFFFFFNLLELLPRHLAAQDVADQWEEGEGYVLWSQSQGRGVDS